MSQFLSVDMIIRRDTYLQKLIAKRHNGKIKAIIYRLTQY